MSEQPDVPRWLDLRPLGLIAVAGALVWSVAIASGTYKSIKIRPEQRTLRVTGSAKKRIASDLIVWAATLEEHAPDRTTAYKQLTADREKAVAFLIAQGIKKEEISPSSTSFEEEFEVKSELKMLAGATAPVKIDTKTPKGYVVHESIVVKSGDVQRVEKASREVTSLLDEGVSVASGQPAYYYTHLGELKVEMLAAAGKDARARADNILKSTGGASIDKLLTADMGIININPANSTETSEEGNNDISSYEKDIITIVHADFALSDD